ncbi:unnamed protein product [Ostreobium quekettii]|uniref:Uncharacterized protein n=1 Tax=Ostreobium quekettii TaxID=121088 RepID=A0A8S1IMJ5_9CHLO|nr:unnamed protein product [Ostreobium quekettii]
MDELFCKQSERWLADPFHAFVSSQPSYQIAASSWMRCFHGCKSEAIVSVFPMGDGDLSLTRGAASNADPEAKRFMAGHQSPCPRTALRACGTIRICDATVTLSSFGHPSSIVSRWQSLPGSAQLNRSVRSESSASLF